MMLTCPNCATRYVVKDGSIGPKGRKVRCASCAHSWHQDPDTSLLVQEDPLPPPVEDAPRVEETPSTPEQDPPPPPFGEGDEPMSEPEAEPEQSAWGNETPVAPPPIPEQEPLPEPPEVPSSAWEESPDADEEQVPVDPVPHSHDGEVETVAQTKVGETQPEPAIEDPIFAVDDSYDDTDEAPKRRWPVIALIGLLLVAVAAAALVAFGPPELRERIGLAQSGPEQSPFTLMFEQQSIVPLEGTDSQRISVRGRIINSTDSEQVVPIIHARVTDGAGELVESWTIDPPQARLGPGESASFNNARVGEFPEESTLTLAVGSTDG
ncbi:MAG: hypothetical protein HKO13_08765 [Sphingomonas sp.]|nr:hypothetical protein [Sphingomonas sp.]RZV49627.1 MAG: hypothetical protein EX258_06945 [Sphingomonadaceae bacterium]